MRIIVAVLAVVVAVIAACTSTTPPPEPGSRYPMARDGAPLRSIKPEDVADAQPRPDPILRVGNASPYSVDGETYEILDDYRGYRERGVASWYGLKFHGYETSNGEIYDLYQATAAHKTLPIPCYARVTNLENGRSMVVRVNDRGPFHSDRLIDLSYAAAVKLGYLEQGTAPVQIEVIDVPGVDDRRKATGGEYRFLQVGAYGSENSARRLQGQLEPLLGVPVSVSPVLSGENLLYRVRVGPLADGDQLLAVQQRLQDSGHGSGQLLP